MVIATRSSIRRASESMDTRSSDGSRKCIPPWCSSGKVSERHKLRKLAPPTWEIRSSYPLRENIWEYLHEDKNFYKRKIKNKKALHKQTMAPNKRWRKTVMSLAILFLVTGVTFFLWMSNNISETNLINVIPRTRNLVSLLGLECRSVDEECCYRMRHLAAALLRAEQVLRSTLRLRKTMMLTAHTIKEDSDKAIERIHIEGATATKGSDTEEWVGRMALWGVVPLWRAAPPPDTVLSSRRPAPADCWPLKGSYGELIIDLPRQVAVWSMSVEHVRPDTARSAPKRFVLYGILENSTWITAVDGEYRERGPAKQYYPSLYKYIPLQRVVFRVLSNQGNPKYTCVYRVHLYEGSV